MHDSQRRACIAGAKAGGRVLLHHFRRLAPGQIHEKTKHDLVSEADRSAEAAIRAELAHRFPAYGFLGEEGGFIPAASRGCGGTSRAERAGSSPAEHQAEEGGFIPAASRGCGGTSRAERAGSSPAEHQAEEGGFIPAASRGCGGTSRAERAGSSPAEHQAEEGGAHGDLELRWIVDPLDGTLNFVQGLPHWCVSVALWDGEGPVVGCILDPLKNDLFEAVRGGGARWNGQPMTVSTQAGLEGAFLATGFAFQLGDRFPLWNKALQQVWPKAKGIRRAGSAALDLAYVACGIYDGFFELGLQKWDMAAGALLVKEAGGRISDWQGGGSWWDSGSLVAGVAPVQQDLVRTFRAAGLVP